jgi:hypothetical protein
MSMFACLLLARAAAMLAWRACASTRPDELRAERCLRNAEPAERLSLHVCVLRCFNRWNSCERRAPAIQGHYASTPSGFGCRYWRASGKACTPAVGTVVVLHLHGWEGVLDFLKVAWPPGYLTIWPQALRRRKALEESID